MRTRIGSRQPTQRRCLVEDPRQVSKLFKITWCARALERIGDHSVNICEYVVYLVKGRDIRHTSFDAIRSEFVKP